MAAPSSRARVVLALLERGLAASILADRDRRRRALIINGTAWTAAIACVLTLPVIAASMSGGERLLSLAVTSATIVVSLAAPWILRRRASLVVAGHWMTAIVFAGVAYAVITNGGLHSPYWILLPTVGLLATQTAGRRAGHVWSAITAASIAALAIVQTAGVELPRFTGRDETMAVFGFIGVMGVLAVHFLTYVADAAKDDAIALAEEAARQVERAEREIDRTHLLAEQAVAANAAKSTLLRVMSHELRTPLNAVIGYAELVRDEAEERGHGDLGEDLGKILTASEHLLTLITDLLDYSRVEFDRLEFQAEPFDARALVDEVARVLGPLALRSRDVLEIDAAEEMIVELDRARVRQVLINLVSNAIKFTEGGRIKIRAAIDGRDHGWLEIEVADTGIGIARADLERIFDAFTQVDASTTRRRDGAGVGLALSRRLVALMGGTLSVRSSLGAGSTFTLRIPLAAQGAATPVLLASGC